MPEEDLHLSDLACSQAHSPGVYAWETKIELISFQPPEGFSSNALTPITFFVSLSS